MALTRATRSQRGLRMPMNPIWFMSCPLGCEGTAAW